MWPAIIAGGASLLGGYLTRQAGADAAQKQMDFQRDMSGTAHQREVADLRAAGLNPILSATGGMGASTPPGATYQPQDYVTPAVGSALQAHKTTSEVDNLVELLDKIKQEVENLKSEQDLTEEKTATEKLIQETERARPGQLRADTALKDTQNVLNKEIINVQLATEALLKSQNLTEKERTKAEAALAGLRNIQRTLTHWESKIAESTAKGAALEGQIDETRYGEIMRYIDRAVKSATGAASARRNLRKD